MKTKVCIICGIDKNFSEYSPYMRKCRSCEHLSRCYMCKEIKELSQFRKGIRRCNSCDNRYHEGRKKIHKTEAYIEKVRRSNKKNYLKRRPLPKPRMTKEESKSVERVRRSIHKIFDRWRLQKKGKSFNYLLYSREDFIARFPIIPEDTHLDHKIPISWFKIDSPIYLIFSLDNLQYIPSIDNISKNNYWSHPISKEYYIKIITYIKEEYKDKLEIEK